MNSESNGNEAVNLTVPEYCSKLEAVDMTVSLTQEDVKKIWRQKYLDKMEPLCQPINALIMSDERLSTRINQIIEAENAIVRNSSQARLSKRYRVQTDSDGRKMLLKLGQKDGESSLQMVSVRQGFEIMYSIHHELDHCGINKLWDEARKRGYANITQESVTNFIPLCNHCNNAHHFQRSVPPVPSPAMAKPPARMKEFGERAQVDIINAHSIEFEGHQWIIRYYDHLTKFEVLRAAKTRHPKEIAETLFQFLSVIGPPHTIQSHSGRDFVLSLIQELKVFWPNCLIKNGRVLQPQSISSIQKFNDKFVTFLSNWCLQNNCKDWTRALHVISLHKNCTPLKGLKSISPYEAVFCRKPPFFNEEGSTDAKREITTESFPLGLDDSNETLPLDVQALQSRKRKHDDLAEKIDTSPNNSCNSYQAFDEKYNFE